MSPPRALCRLSIVVPAAGASGHRVPQADVWGTVAAMLKTAFREQLALDKRSEFVVDLDMVIRAGNQATDPTTALAQRILDINAANLYENLALDRILEECRGIVGVKGSNEKPIQSSRQHL